jgi:hypothetical protein
MKVFKTSAIAGGLLISMLAPQTMAAQSSPDPATRSSEVTPQRCSPNGCCRIGAIEVCPKTKDKFTARELKSLEKALRNVKIK